MTNTTTPIKKENANVPSAENQKGIENHKKAAKHLEEAAKNHHEAAIHHENGNHDDAFRSTVKAHGHLALAADAQREDLKHHALNS